MISALGLYYKYTEIVQHPVTADWDQDDLDRL